MAMTQEIREIEIRAREQGVSQTTGALERLAAADDAVAVASERVERSTASLARGMESLQRRVDENYRATQQLARDSALLADARARDLISVDRHTQLLALAQNRYRGVSGAVTEVGAKTKLASHEVGMMGAQFMDLGTQIASGGGLFLPIIQQGGQLAGQLGDRGVKGAVTALGQGLVAFAANPINLAVVGIAGLAAGASYLFDKFSDGVSDVDRMTEALRRQKAVLDSLGKSYDEQRGLSNFGPNVTAAEAIFNAKTLQADYRAAGEDILTKFGAFRLTRGASEFQVFPQFKPIEEELKQLRAGAKAGSPDFMRTIEAAADAYRANPTEQNREMYKAVREGLKDGVIYQRMLPAAQAAEMDPEGKRQRQVEFDNFLSSKQSEYAALLEQRRKEEEREAERRQRSATAAANRLGVRESRQDLRSYERQVGLYGDIVFDQQQFGRTGGEQAIYSRLRSAELLGPGGEIDSQFGQVIAAQLRWNQAAEKTADIFEGIGAELMKIRSLGDLKDVLLSRLLNATMKEGGEQLDSLFRRGVQSLMGPGPIAGYQPQQYEPFGGVNYLAAAARVKGRGDIVRSPLAPSGDINVPGAGAAGLNPIFAERLSAFLAEAPDGGLSVYSGYRSPEHQQALYAAALAKYGSPEAARRWVAPPGRSMHNFGEAADLSFATPAARAWAHDNAGAYGLRFPMGNEPWHIEPIGGRRQGGVLSADQLPQVAAKTADSFGKLDAAAAKSAGGLDALGGGFQQFGQALGGAAGAGGAPSLGAAAAGGDPLGGLLLGGLGLIGKFAGFFAEGGRIPAGRFGIAGERGPEPVWGPASVMSHRDMADALRAGPSGDRGGAYREGDIAVHVHGDMTEDRLAETKRTLKTLERERTKKTRDAWRYRTV
jgi:hypothetical protein